MRSKRLIVEAFVAVLLLGCEPSAPEAVEAAVAEQAPPATLVEPWPCCVIGHEFFQNSRWARYETGAWTCRRCLLTISQRDGHKILVPPQPWRQAGGQQ
jgi:hypothetical protein